MATNEREEAGHKKRAPDPDDGDHEPRLEEGLAEDVFGCIHGQRPEHPVAQERRDAPIRGDAGPALEIGLRSRMSRGGYVELFLDDGIDDVVVVVAFRRAEGEFLFAEVRPVEVLGLEEGEDERVGDRAKCRCDRAVDAGEDLTARRYSHTPVHRLCGPQPHGEPGGHA